MAFKIVWTKRSSVKFDLIIDHLCKEWNEKVTKSFVKKVYDFIDILKDYPEIGQLAHKGKNIRGFILIKQICIYYKIKSDIIIIFSVEFIIDQEIKFQGLKSSAIFDVNLPYD